MKYLTVCVLFYIISIYTLNAQSKFELGVTSGPEWNFPISKNEQIAYDFKPHAGFVTALRLRHNFNHMFSMVGGFEYTRFYYNEQNHSSYFGSSGYLGNQLRVPILFQMNIGKNKSQFFFNTGPTFLYSFADLNNSSMIAFPDDPSPSYSPPFPHRLYLDANMGWMFGSGYSYSPLDFFRIFTEMRLCGSFLSTPSGIQNEGVNVMSITWNFGFSFRMKPTKKQF
jgi:hypothetical protein